MCAVHVHELDRVEAAIQATAAGAKISSFRDKSASKDCEVIFCPLLDEETFVAQLHMRAKVNNLHPIIYF